VGAGDILGAFFICVLHLRPRRSGLAEQTAAYEANKRRAREHADNAVALADFAIKTLQDHKQIAALEATDAHA